MDEAIRVPSGQNAISRPRRGRLRRPAPRSARRREQVTGHRCQTTRLLLPGRQERRSATNPWLSSCDSEPPRRESRRRWSPTPGGRQHQAEELAQRRHAEDHPQDRGGTTDGRHGRAAERAMGNPRVESLGQLRTDEARERHCARLGRREGSGPAEAAQRSRGRRHAAPQRLPGQPGVQRRGPSSASCEMMSCCGSRIMMARLGRASVTRLTRSICAAVSGGPKPAQVTPAMNPSSPALPPTRRPVPCRTFRQKLRPSISASARWANRHRRAPGRPRAEWPRCRNVPARRPRRPSAWLARWRPHRRPSRRYGPGDARPR